MIIIYFSNIISSSYLNIFKQNFNNLIKISFVSLELISLLTWTQALTPCILISIVMNRQFLLFRAINAIHIASNKKIKITI